MPSFMSSVTSDTDHAVSPICSKTAMALVEELRSSDRNLRRWRLAAAPLLVFCTTSVRDQSNGPEQLAIRSHRRQWFGRRYYLSTKLPDVDIKPKRSRAPLRRFSLRTGRDYPLEPIVGIGIVKDLLEILTEVIDLWDWDEPVRAVFSPLTTPLTKSLGMGLKTLGCCLEEF